MKFEDKSGIIVFIPDSEGNSTYSDLMNAMKEEEINAAKTGDETALRELGMELGSYIAAWSDAFDFKPGDVFMFVDVKDILYAAWMKDE